MGKKREKTIDFDGSTPSKSKGIIIVLMMALAILSLLSIFDLAGSFGRSVYHILRLVFGWGFWIFPILLALTSYFALYPRMNFFQSANWWGLGLTVLGYSGLFHLIRRPEMVGRSLETGSGGGYVGYLILAPLMSIMGRWGSLVVMIAMMTIGLLLLFNTTLENLIERITLKTIRLKVKEFFHYRRLKRLSSELDEEAPDFRGREVSDVEETEENEKPEDKEIGKVEPTDQEMSEQKEIEPKKEKKRYPKIFLPTNILNDKAGKPTAGDIVFCQEKIKKTLSHFGIEIEMGGISVGPTVTQYTFRPADGVKLSRIIGLSNDLALALAAHPIRIEAPIPGKSLVGVEVPNKKIAVVPLRQVLESQEFKERKSNMTIILGQDVAGKSCITDLTRLPHLLVAGATNSGKTVCLNSIIISLLYQNQPDELKFILVDPKRVEMTSYDNIPYLLTPVITDVKKTINSLKWTIGEMERRFHILSHAGKRNIQSYNVTHPNDRLPYIVFIIDELADLMSMAGAEVEAAVIRLAQMARAVGIHLVLATQRPSVDIITGLIKANIPGRIAFSVASLTDSRTILDASGAEKLLGRGDMLYTSAELSKPKRIQGAFCSDEDIEKVTEYLRRSGSPDYLDEVTEKQNTLGLGGVVLSGDEEGGEDRLGEARELIISERKASASYLQRRMKIGYAKAARILDLLEQQGVVGPADGAKPREILIKKGERDEAQEFIDQASKGVKRQENSYEDEYEEEEEEIRYQEPGIRNQELKEKEGEEEEETEYQESEIRDQETEEGEDSEEDGENESETGESGNEGEEDELEEENFEESEEERDEEKEKIKEDQREEEKYNF